VQGHLDTAFLVEEMAGGPTMLGKIGVEDSWFELFKLSNTVNMSEIMHANIWIPEV